MLAIAGGKGGSGKTTTALGVAMALGRAGESPLVVDADVDMPDLHVLAGVDPEPGAGDLDTGVPIERVRQPWPALPTVGIVAAGEADRLGVTLDRLTGWHGPVIVDCPGGAGPDSAVPLRACDESLLVTTDAPQALADTAKTATVARELDAAPLAALVRDSSTGARKYLDCSRILSVPDIDTADVLSAPAFQDFCWSVSGMIPRQNQP
jgi:septum site-determining protein MinD